MFGNHDRAKEANNLLLAYDCNRDITNLLDGNQIASSKGDVVQLVSAVLSGCLKKLLNILIQDWPHPKGRKHAYGLVIPLFHSYLGVAEPSSQAVPNWILR